MSALQSRSTLLVTLTLLLAFCAGAAFIHTQEVRAAVPSEAKLSGAVAGHSLQNGVSKSLRELSGIKGVGSGQVHTHPARLIPHEPKIGPQAKDPVAQLQAAIGLPAMPTPIASFEGISNTANINVFGGAVNPPDTEGDVGPNDYVQWVNLLIDVYDKQTGLSRLPDGPVPGSALFTVLGSTNACATSDDGDPIALYDPISDRWLLSQFALPGFSGSGGFHQCVAVSVTGDPTGSYYVYDFLLSNVLFNDYPHFGVWPDAYYATVNMFDPVNPIYYGPWAIGFDRAQMLVGQQASFQYFQLPSTGQVRDSPALLPADLDGHNLPSAGAPGLFMNLGFDENGRFNNTLTLYKFHIDWGNPANSTFSAPTVLATQPYLELCPADIVPTGNCIPQPARQQLESIADRLMYRLAYRNFGDHESLVVNHSVEVGDLPGQVHAGVRWYEVRSPYNNPSIYQQGTYAPDAASRWMGSAAMDGSGDLAVGYSVSSHTIFPSIRYAGRLATDPLGTLAQGEATLFAGGGSQTGGGNRWGDYSMLGIDPTDDCTFWYTNEYYPITSTVGWHTRIGSFKFPSCTGRPPVATPTATGTAATLTVGPSATPCAISFSDVHPTDYFYTAVQYLACHGVISGYSDGTFRPYNYTTRGQIAKIVVLALSIPPYTPPTPTFRDVPSTDTFYMYIEAAAHSNIVSGYQCGSQGEPCPGLYYRPYNNVTRGQLSKIVVIAATQARGWSLINPPGGTFSDVPPNSEFYTYIETAVCHGIISGYADGTFRPFNYATRGQIAKIVYLAVTSNQVCESPATSTATGTRGTGTPARTVTPQPSFTRTVLSTSTVTPTATRTPIVPCVETTINGAISSADPTQVGRLGRDSIPSDCTYVKGCPGPFQNDTAPRHYDAYTFRNDTGNVTCVTVTLSTSCPGSNPTAIFSEAYSGSYIPADLCANYLADLGNSPNNGTPSSLSYSFTVDPGATYVVVVNGIYSAGTCSAYTLTVSCGTPLP